MNRITYLWCRAQMRSWLMTHDPAIIGLHVIILLAIIGIILTIIFTTKGTR